MSVPENIILGDGVFYLGATPIALTRGGGKFTIERENRIIEADGDFGPVKGRIRKVKSVAKLMLKALEILPANMPKFYPGMTLTATSAVLDTLTASTDIADADYQDEVSWAGLTKDGKAVVIALENAINLENIELELLDKDEIVPEITYTATYLENARTTEHWSVEFAKADAFNVQFVVLDDTSKEPISGAIISYASSGDPLLNSKTTDANGNAKVTNLAADTYDYEVIADSYTDVTGVTFTIVDDNVIVSVEMTAAA